MGKVLLAWVTSAPGAIVLLASKDVRGSDMESAGESRYQVTCIRLLILPALDGFIQRERVDILSRRSPRFGILTSTSTRVGVSHPSGRLSRLPVTSAHSNVSFTKSQRLQ
ncbi:uncharacterized protein EV420DRAFT_637857 [Desarmillaria tabescens]|uniref:Secreted protein n=1 Tax=Armillaria tabescens TaxID=1929756 RepID=A0AA39MF45_ARMTA|nr:uncharacterized protein EV420DRAFT_637857 [Desarmillaria tabescens]KAK0432541.1 hypothetical protein EV420DRAFT_637857 [Desarmillaria tabescens]